MVYFGIKRLKRGKNDLYSYILIALGIFFMMSSFEHLHPIFSIIRHFFLPLTIIFIGLILLLRSKSFSYNEYNYQTREEFRDFEDGYTYNNQNDALFSNSEPVNDTFRQSEQQFNRNGSGKTAIPERIYNTTFNSNSITLNESDFEVGLNSIVLNCTFGEVKLSLPKTVNILFDGQSTFADIRFLNKKYDGIHKTSKVKYTAPAGADKTVHINAFAQFSNISVVLHE